MENQALSGLPLADTFGPADLLYVVQGAHSRKGVMAALCAYVAAVVGPGAVGPAGADGKTVRSGTGPPNGTIGVDGDFYVATGTWMVYGPKALGAWPAGVSLVGSQGPQGPSGAVGPAAPQMRLTLEPGVAVSVADQTGKSVLYWTPYRGRYAWLVDEAGVWQAVPMVEIGIALAGLTSGKGYDVFAWRGVATPSSILISGGTAYFGSPPGWATGSCAWVSASWGGLTAGTPYWLRVVDANTYSFHTSLAGALANTGKVTLSGQVGSAVTAVTLELSAAWTSDAVRSGALGWFEGFAIKSGDAKRLHVGGIYTTGVTTTEDSALKRLVSNRFNRVGRKLERREATASWNYTVATWRQANGATANQVEWFDAQQEAAVSCSALGSSYNATASEAGTGIGVDSTSVVSAGVNVTTAAKYYEAGLASLVVGPLLGRHFLTWLERSAATGTRTWYREVYGTGGLCGLIGKVET